MLLNRLKIPVDIVITKPISEPSHGENGRDAPLQGYTTP